MATINKISRHTPNQMKQLIIYTMNSIQKISLFSVSLALTSLTATSQTIENKSVQSKTTIQSAADTVNSFKVVPFGNQQFPIELKLNDTPIEPATQPSSETIEQLFVPIPASGYTDENYHINKEKSALQEERMNAIPVPAPTPVDVQTRISNYSIERDKYPINSVEYNQIQGKINVLLSEVEK